MLQWGRRVNTAETYCIENAHQTNKSLLQWGRRVNTAETRRNSRTARASGPPSFNGAAAGTRRKRTGARGAALLELQASMGPPREHGGNASTQGLAGAAGAVLQWGRRVNTAETLRGLTPAGTRCPWLQWGRRVNTAETWQ